MMTLTSVQRVAFALTLSVCGLAGCPAPVPGNPNPGQTGSVTPAPAPMTGQAIVGQKPLANATIYVHDVIANSKAAAPGSGNPDRIELAATPFKTDADGRFTLPLAVKPGQVAYVFISDGTQAVGAVVAGNQAIRTAGKVAITATTPLQVDFDSSLVACTMLDSLTLLGKAAANLPQTTKAGQLAKAIDGMTTAAVSKAKTLKDLLGGEDAGPDLAKVMIGAGPAVTASATTQAIGATTAFGITDDQPWLIVVPPLGGSGPVITTSMLLNIFVLLRQTRQDKLTPDQTTKFDHEVNATLRDLITSAKNGLGSEDANFLNLINTVANGGDPTGSPSGAATPTPAPTGLPSTPDTSARATIQGVVFDDLGTRLEGVTITGKVLGAGTFANGSDTLSVSTQIGSYALNGAPTGATVQVTASKQGYTTRVQTIVPLANLQGDTTINNVTFGETKTRTGFAVINFHAQAAAPQQTISYIDPVYALSDKPEVTAFTPAQDATGVDPSTSFTLTFDEPVNTADVESLFAIYVAGPRSDVALGNAMTNPGGGNQGRYTLSASSTPLYYTFDPNKDDGSYNGTPTNVRVSTAPIYDSASFTAAWSNSNQTVTFTFRPGAKLPTDKDSSKLPQYAVSFKNGSIRDAAGTGRADSWFRVSPAQVGRVGYKFTVAADTTAPRVVSITPVNKTDTNNSNQDVIRVLFSETMALYPGNNGGASIPTAADAGQAALQANYLYYVSEAGTTEYPNKAQTTDNAGMTTAPGDWDAYGTAASNNGNQGGFMPNVTSGAVKYYDGDATRSTVEFHTNNDDQTQANQKNKAYTTGNNVWVNARGVIIDPANNSLDTSNNINVRSGIAQ